MIRNNEMDIALDITIQDKEGNYINKLCKVCLNMSMSAMLEFGKALIRNALQVKGSDVYHFNHAGSGLGIDIRFGIILHPESVEPIIIDDIDPTVSTSFEEELLHNAEFFLHAHINNDKQEILEDNIILFKVFDLDNCDISKNCQYVIMYMHKYSKIGFGAELIRLANNFEEGKEVYIIPASNENGAQQSMGIFLTPDSCELVIKCKSFGPIDKILEEYKKTHE